MLLLICVYRSFTAPVVPDNTTATESVSLSVSSAVSVPVCMSVFVSVFVPV